MRPLNTERNGTVLYKLDADVWRGRRAQQGQAAARCLRSCCRLRPSDPAGYDPIVLVQIGPEEDAFIEFFERALAPALRQRAAMAQAATPAPPRDPTQDGFEDQVDRDATLAGSEDDPGGGAPMTAPAKPPVAVALDRSETRWHVRLCQWIAPPRAAARHGS